MKLTERIKNEMVLAMKVQDKPRKTMLTMLVSTLTSAAKDKLRDLTAEEEVEIVTKELKNLKDTLTTMRTQGRDDLADEAEYRISIVSEFLPKQMTADEINAVITSVIAELGIEPTANQKGTIMKVLMPKVRGKADGKLVDSILKEYMK